MYSQIKKEARLLQKGKTGITLGFFAVYVMIFAAFFLLSSVLKDSAVLESRQLFWLNIFFVVCCLALFSVFKTGYKKFCFLQSKNGNVGAKAAFNFLLPKNFFRLLGFSAVLFLLKLASLLVCLLPSGVFAVYVMYRLSQGVIKEVFSLLCLAFAAFFACGLWFYFKFKRLLFLSHFFFFEGGEKGAFAAIQKSICQMNKNTSKLIALRLRFSAWFLCCASVIPLFFVVGYYAQSSMIFARRIIKNAA